MTRLFRLYSSDRPHIKGTLRSILRECWFARPFAGSNLRVLIIFYPSRIALTQVHPFFHYSVELKLQYSIDLRAVSINDFLVSDQRGPRDADIVLLQSWFDLESTGQRRVFSSLQKLHPRARVIYLDWFAPLDLRLAEYLNDKISLYIKKQRFRDTDMYKQPIYGSTNLEDYYGRLYSINSKLQTHLIPDGFFDKMKLGPGFFTESEMINGFRMPMPPPVERAIDVNARMTHGGPGWYGKMRHEALRAIETLKGCHVVTGFRPDRRAFRNELRRSKLCFSPFGYGEVCLRDYEAIMAGSALVKPDVSHLVTYPDIFRPFETYIPVDWHFANFAEKVEYYLVNEPERQRIAKNAYQVIHEYIAKQKFIDFVGDML